MIFPKYRLKHIFYKKKKNHQIVRKLVVDSFNTYECKIRIIEKRGKELVLFFKHGIEKGSVVFFNKINVKYFYFFFVLKEISEYDIFVTGSNNP